MASGAAVMALVFPGNSDGVHCPAKPATAQDGAGAHRPLPLVFRAFARELGASAMLHHSILVLLLAALGLSVPAQAGERIRPRQADPAYLATIKDDFPNPLPKGLAPWERPIRSWQIRGATPPPKGRVRAPAEYEYNQGIFIRWGSGKSLV